MRVSAKLQELTQLKYDRKVAEISGIRYAEIKRLESGKRSGSTLKAMNDVLFKLAKELTKLRSDMWLDNYRVEGLIPNQQDLGDICWELDRIVDEIKYQHRSGAIPLEKYMTIVPSIKRDLVIAIKEMELEQEKPIAAQPAGHIYNINIHGNNSGAIQQGGSGNTQSINRSDDED
jgi:transcriptional regulator with XRE-family HTH domain